MSTFLTLAEAYDELGLGGDGHQPSVTSVKQAFKRLALLYHPDKNKTKDGEEKFKKVLRAYETILQARTTRGGDAAAGGGMGRDGADFSSFYEYYFNHANGPDESVPFEQKFDDLLQKLFAGFSEEEEKEEESEENCDLGFGPQGALVESRAGAWAKEEEKSDEERRKSYFCGTDYVNINTVENWPTYIATNKIAQLPLSEARVACDDKIAQKVAVLHHSVAFIEADAILNSVSEHLMRGGGADGAIRRSAGDKIEWELSLCGYVAAGSCVITRGYRLPAKYVIHCCGPVGGGPKRLALCYKNALDLAVRHKIRTIAMCGISAGNNCYPLNESARVALKTVRRWMEVGNNADKLDKVLFVCYYGHERKAYEHWMQKYFPVQAFLAEPVRELEHKNVNENSNTNNENKNANSNATDDNKKDNSNASDNAADNITNDSV